MGRRLVPWWAWAYPGKLAACTPLRPRPVRFGFGCRPSGQSRRRRVVRDRQDQAPWSL